MSWIFFAPVLPTRAASVAAAKKTYWSMAGTWNFVKRSSDVVSIC